MNHRWVKILGCLLLAAAASGCGHRSEVRSLRRQAYEAERRGDYETALVHLDNLLQLDPENVWAYANRGSVHDSLGEIDKAIADYSQAIKLDPRNSYAHCYRGCAYGKMGDLQNSLKDLEVATDLDPDNMMAQYSLGFTCLTTGDTNAANASFKRATSLPAETSSEHTYRGLAFFRLNQPGPALEEFNKALDMDHDNADALVYRATVYSLQGDYAKAEEDYRHLVRIKPGVAVVYNNLAWILATCPAANLRNGIEATNNAMKACDLSQWKDPVCLDTLAAAAAEAGDFEAAIRYQQQAIEANPRGPLLERMQKRLELYQHQEPYHETAPQPEPSN